MHLIQNEEKMWILKKVLMRALWDYKFTFDENVIINK